MRERGGGGVQWHSVSQLYNMFSLTHAGKIYRWLRVVHGYPQVAVIRAFRKFLMYMYINLHTSTYMLVTAHNAHTLPRATKYYKGQSSFHILRTEISPSNKRCCTEGLCREPMNDATLAHIHVHVHAHLYMYVHVTTLATMHTQHIRIHSVG